MKQITTALPHKFKFFELEPGKYLLEVLEGSAYAFYFGKDLGDCLNTMKKENTL